MPRSPNSQVTFMSDPAETCVLPQLIGVLGEARELAVLTVHDGSERVGSALLPDPARSLHGVPGRSLAARPFFCAPEGQPTASYPSTSSG